MPISDTEPYEVGHFSRVYEYIIKPACLEAGFSPLRADEVQKTNYIVIDILKHIVDADMALCDLSTRNPNVLYELGIRQAFNLPVTLIKDSLTTRIFDIQGLRDIEYDENLRIDTVNLAIKQISTILVNTYKAEKEEVNSVIQLLGINPAQIQSPMTLSGETSLLLNAISNLGERLSEIENSINNDLSSRGKTTLSNRKKSYNDSHKNIIYEVGNKVLHDKWGEGEVISVSGDEIKVAFPSQGIKTLASNFAPLNKIMKIIGEESA